MDAKAKILVVDDDPAVLFSLKGVLTRDGYQVTAVESGEAALEHISDQDFDLALIDLKLKGMGGMEVLAALRERSPGTVAIILTAHASLESAVEALRQGAHDYLFKPCTAEELRESVRTGLSKHRVPGPPSPAAEAVVPAVQPAAAVQEAASRVLQWKGVTVDPLRHTITVDGQPLELTPTEFSLLAYLVQEAPRVVPSEELVREVQGYETEPWEARDIVRFHIHRIRRKSVLAAGREGLVRTVRGVGYTLGD